MLTCFILNFYVYILRYIKKWPLSLINNSMSLKTHKEGNKNPVMSLVQSKNYRSTPVKCFLI